MSLENQLSLSYAELQEDIATFNSVIDLLKQQRPSTTLLDQAVERVRQLGTITEITSENERAVEVEIAALRIYLASAQFTINSMIALD